MATSGQLDRFDGEPDQQYMEDISAHMTKIFASWDCRSDHSEFLQQESEALIFDFEAKFPFSIHRFNDRCYTKKDIDPRNIARPGSVRYFNTPSDPNHQTKHAGSLVVADAKAKQTRDPRRSAEELRLAQVS